MKARYLRGYESLSCWLVLIRLRDGVTNRWAWREMLHEEIPYWAMHYAVRAINDGHAVCLCAPGGIIAAELYPSSYKASKPRGGVGSGASSRPMKRTSGAFAIESKHAPTYPNHPPRKPRRS